MSFKCFFGQHSWNGCKCIDCGKVKDEQHSWAGCKCTICGKVKDENHLWEGCICLKCLKRKNEDHTWNGCTCSKCGIEKHDLINGTCINCKEVLEINIGNQIWQTKNLNTNYYLNGDVIPEVSDNKNWVKLKTGAWCYYNNDTKNGKIYGKLYNAYAFMDPRGIAPNAYHIPTTKEFEELLNNWDWKELLTQGQGEMKNVGTNKSGFSALFAGERFFGSKFTMLGQTAAFWCSDFHYPLISGVPSSYPDGKKDVRIYIKSKGVYWRAYTAGTSIRCIKDK